MQRLRIGALFAALVAATALVTSGSAGVAAPKAGGTIVFGAEQSPECWNVLLADCNLFWSGILTGPVLEGAYAIYPDLSKRPQLVSGATVTTKPFTVTYNIRPEAKWNDGVQVSADDFIYEPEPEEILARLLPVYVETEVYRALLESAASEQGARMTAMRNASKNAGELIDNLTLAMNRARQAEITQEILEVVAGADALTA